MTDEVKVERHGEHLLIVTLNRPLARNAINGPMTQAIAGAVRQAEADDSIRAVILTAGSNDIFCAGADLKELAAGRVTDMVTAEGGFAGFVRIERKKPWIAAVAGKALGGGMELSLACDMIVAGQGASFGLPEVLRGIFAGGGGVFRLPRVIPRAIALEMLTTGQPVDAARAYALGLINRVVATADVLTEAIQIATRIASAAPLAVYETLAIARVASEHTEQELWELSRQISVRISRSEDFREGPKAFAEKRTPVWKGR